MLCLGAVKYCYESRSHIWDDPELGMSDRIFLEEYSVDKQNLGLNLEPLELFTW